MSRAENLRLMGEYVQCPLGTPVGTELDFQADDGMWYRGIVTDVEERQTPDGSRGFCRFNVDTSHTPTTHWTPQEEPGR